MDEVSLADMPDLILELILLERLSDEIVSRNLMRTARDENVCQLINELRSVCTKWNDCLTSNAFCIRFQRQLKKLGSFVYKENPLLLGSIPIDQSNGIIVGTGILGKDFLLTRFKLNDRSSGLEDGRKGYLVTVEFYERASLRLTRSWTLDGITNVSDIVTSGSDRCLYILCTENDEEEDGSLVKIWRVDPNGQLICKWNADKNCSPEARMSVTEESSVIVVLSGSGDVPPGIVEYSPDGHLIRRVSLVYDVDVIITCAIKLPDGRYVLTTIPRSGNDKASKVIVLDVEGNVLKTIVATKENGWYLHLASDGEGSILVLEIVDVDESRGYVSLLSTDLEFKRQVVLSKSDAVVSDGCHFRLDLSNGRLFVNDFRQISVYDVRAEGR